MLGRHQSWKTKNYMCGKKGIEQMGKRRNFGKGYKNYFTQGAIVTWISFCAFCLLSHLFSQIPRCSKRGCSTKATLFESWIGGFFIMPYSVVVRSFGSWHHFFLFFNALTISWKCLLLFGQQTVRCMSQKSRYKYHGLDIPGFDSKRKFHFFQDLLNIWDNTFFVFF